jgi:hypothetical protein
MRLKIQTTNPETQEVTEQCLENCRLALLEEAIGLLIVRDADGNLHQFNILTPGHVQLLFDNIFGG